jgi:hypothetical protein
MLAIPGAMEAGLDRSRKSRALACWKQSDAIP